MCRPSLTALRPTISYHNSLKHREAMQLYIAIALTIAALVALVMAYRTPATASRSQTLGYAVAPLAAAWLVALLTPAPDGLFYKGALVLGLLLAIVGFLFHRSGFLPNYVAHAHLVLTYTLYAYAFASQTSGWPTPWALLLLAAAALLYWWLHPALAELRISVAVYGGLVLLTTWQALELAVQQPSALIGWAALGGMLLAACALLLEAQARFKQWRPTWAMAALPLFLVAHLVIAWSTWG